MRTPRYARLSGCDDMRLTPVAELPGVALSRLAGSLTPGYYREALQASQLSSFALPGESTKGHCHGQFCLSASRDADADTRDGVADEFLSP